MDINGKYKVYWKSSRNERFRIRFKNPLMSGEIEVDRVSYNMVKKGDYIDIQQNFNKTK